MWKKVTVNLVYIPPRKGKKYIVDARDDFSEWIEARAIPSKEAKHVAKFLWEEIVCRHGLFGELVVNKGKKNIGEVIDLLNKYDIKRIKASAYHPQVNGMLETGYRPLKNSLSKLTAEK